MTRKKAEISAKCFFKKESFKKGQKKQVAKIKLI